MMNSSYYSTIIKAILVIMILHFWIKRFSKQIDRKSIPTQSRFLKDRNLKDTQQIPNVTELPIIEADIPNMSDDSDTASTISREDVVSLRKSLMDFIDSQQVDFETAATLPQDKSYAPYKPVTMSDQSTGLTFPTVKDVHAVTDSQFNNSYMSAEDVSNGGLLMPGVTGYESTDAYYSLGGSA